MIEVVFSAKKKKERVAMLMERPLGGSRLCAVLIDGTPFRGWMPTHIRAGTARRPLPILYALCREQRRY
jgi:hypothetical protein